MSDIRVSIFDPDKIRAEAIKDILVQEGYLASIFSTETNSLRSLIEDKCDVVFLSLDMTKSIVEYLAKIKSYAPEIRIVGIIGGKYNDYQFTLAELGITKYIETPINSTMEIIDVVQKIETEILKDEEKSALMISILEFARDAAKTDKKILKKINIALNLFANAPTEQNKIRGDIKDTPYYEVLRIICSLYKEGMLEFVNEEERALLIIKNNSVVSAYVTPGVRGLKAFLRIAGWNKGTFNFKTKINVSYALENDLYNVDITRLYHLAKKANEWFIRMRNNLPPKELQVRLDTRMTNNKLDLTSAEFDVLTTIVEHNLIGDVVNYNSNIDTDILDALISLRRKGAIEVKVD